MRYTAAYLLAALGGNKSPDVASIAKILGSVGIECDEKRAQKVIDACKDRDIEEIIAEGMKKIDNVPSTDIPVTTTTNLNGEPPVGTHEPPKSPNQDVCPMCERAGGCDCDDGGGGMVSSAFSPTVFIFIDILLFLFNSLTYSVNGKYHILTITTAKKNFILKFNIQYLVFVFINTIKYELILSNMKYQMNKSK
jgi:hypothetical protein